MIITGKGVNASEPVQVDLTHAALRTSLRPCEKGVYGSYQIALATGLIAAGAQTLAPVFAFRWTTASANTMIRRVRTSLYCTTAFAAGAGVLDMIRATAFSAQDTAGATISLVGKAQAKSTRFAASQQQIAASATGNIAISSTSVLSAGTRTLDSNPIAGIFFPVVATANSFVVPITTLWDPAEAGREPLELQATEGFILRATVPATGVWTVGVEVEWDEIDPARYFG